MKHFICGLVFMFSLITSLAGQTIKDKIGMGINLGGQKLYGDLEHTGFGFGIETYLKYMVNDRLFTTSSLGYGELSDGTFHVDKSTFVTNLFNFDVKFGYHLMPAALFNPYAIVGIGAINFKYQNWDRFFDGTFIVGGGAEFKLSPQLALDLSADYRYTTGDDFDGLNATAKDGYLNLRGGFTYYLKPRGDVFGPKMIAARVPVEELSGTVGEDEDMDSIIDGIEDFEQTDDSNLAMGEYVKLKSRVDELGDAIRQKELEIEELRAQLTARKDRVGELENNMKKRGGALASSIQTNVMDFATSYEEALENFYAREYDAAIYVFNMLLDSYPNHRLAGNCHYWLGESYFGKKDYNMALQSFGNVFNYHDSVKKDDSLLMMGRAYTKIGNYQMARQMYQRLMNEYPDSEYFYKAERYANDL